MTYKVFGGTLSHTQSINHVSCLVVMTPLLTGIILECLLMQGYRSKDADDSKSGSNPANASLIKRFNQHSTMVLKSCDKKSAAAVSASTAAATVESGAERLPKDVTVNGGIHVNAVTSTQNSTVVSSQADVTGSDDVAEKHVRLYYLLLLLFLFAQQHKGKRHDY